jgi:serine/threonine-protein kinase
VEVRQTLGGRYKLLDELGNGGMAVVWRARDEVLGRPVAVKLLAGRYSDDPQSRARIRDEARAAATLSHPNICQVYDYGEATATGTPYVVMELVNGPTLQQRVSGGKLPPRTVFRICGEVAAALAAAHADGLVHRDIKMANIMVTPAGAKVVDFGIAAAAGPASPEEMLVGTPAYLAPERLTGDLIVPASDVYALGVLLYRLLADEPPWSVESTTQMLRAHVYLDPAPLPALPGVPPAVSDLIDRCLRKNPEARPSATEVSATLADAAEAAQAADTVRGGAPGLPPHIPLPADGRAESLDEETSVRSRPRRSGDPGTDSDAAPGRSRRGVNAGPEPDLERAANAGPAGLGAGGRSGAGVDGQVGAAGLPGESAGASSGGRRNARYDSVDHAGRPSRGDGNRRAGPQREVLGGGRRNSSPEQRHAKTAAASIRDEENAGGLARLFEERRRVLLVGAILAIVIAALVGLALGGHSRVTGSAPETAATETAAPTMSSGLGGPTASGGVGVTRPAGTGVPVRPPVAGSEPIASVDPSSGGPSASTDPSASPSPSATRLVAPDGKRLDSPGGFVYAACEQGKATLTYWEAKPGFTVDKVEPGPALTALIIFKGTPARYRMTVTCVAGSPTPVVLPL